MAVISRDAELRAQAGLVRSIDSSMVHLSNSMDNLQRLGTQYGTQPMARQSVSGGSHWMSSSPALGFQCPRCGHPFTQGDSFCRKCGQQRPVGSSPQWTTEGSARALAEADRWSSAAAQARPQYATRPPREDHFAEHRDAAESQQRTEVIHEICWYDEQNAQLLAEVENWRQWRKERNEELERRVRSLEGIYMPGHR
eukprot:TRINITY_DN10383_c0_g1_i1.p1 TRINITY_DN10383_c0_g1~~TRINITY_DN10383_c0_g1_i1.p1  ORF type:complete len:197 (-),score=10.99 TRINITY_DN10383_c0_g1_i1:191-781(-)